MNTEPRESVAASASGPAQNRAATAAASPRTPYPVAELKYDWLPEGSARRSGPVILMLPGWRNERTAMRPLGSLLSSYHDTLLLGLPGFAPGESPMHDGSWGTSEYADCVYAFLAEQKLSNIILVGHSYGTRVGIQLAARHPELVRALILIAGAGLQPVGLKRAKRDLKVKCNRFLRKKPVQGLLAAAGAVLPDSLVQSCQARYQRQFVSGDFTAAGTLRVTLNKAVNEDLSPLAAQIKQPTLLLYGEHDTDTPPDYGLRYRNLLQHSDYIRMDGKGHFPHTTTGASLCAYYIVRFLAANGDCGSAKGK